jgi:hypothetical protein
MSENPVTPVNADPNSPTPGGEPARSPLKLVVIIGLVLIALLVFGAMDS